MKKILALALLSLSACGDDVQDVSCGEPWQWSPTRPGEGWYDVQQSAALVGIRRFAARVQYISIEMLDRTVRHIPATYWADTCLTADDGSATICATGDGTSSSLTIDGAVYCGQWSDYWY